MAIPDAARRGLEQRLELHKHQRWPHLHDLTVRYRGDYAYLSGTDLDGPLPLCRLRWLCSPDDWGYACYLASKNSYEDSILPTGSFTGTPEQALDCSCGLYLNDPPAWLNQL
jgi:hypothetical protein